MKNRYERCIKQWDEIFSSEDVSVPISSVFSINILDEALDWLCADSENILDFGCGEGTLLFYCGLKGVKNNIGIDLSQEGISLANKRKQLMDKGAYHFIYGSIDALRNIDNEIFDGILLSNIIDNLYPEDAAYLLNQVNRVLKPKGKVLVKTNPFITDQQIIDYGIIKIDNGLLDDGLLLWNNTNKEWEHFFETFFIIEKTDEVYYESHQMTNRLFFLKKKK